MNIKLTQTEAINMLRDHLRQIVQVEPIHITIEPAVTADHDNKTVELVPLIRAIRNSSAAYGGSPKIAAIKAVRSELESQGLFVGLADAKSFVEHFIP